MLIQNDEDYKKACSLLKLSLELGSFILLDPVFNNENPVNEALTQEQIALKNLLRIQRVLANQNSLFPKNTPLHLLASQDKLSEEDKSLLETWIGDQ